MILKGKTIALGVTGGIAAYKACEIVSLLKKNGADVRVVMTKNAAEFVAPLTFETLSDNRVTIDMFDRNFEREIQHIALAKRADAFLIAPASANFIGKLANGIADDFLSTTVMAAVCPVIIAPAMNTAMLNSAANTENINKLKSRNVKFISSETGLLACGDIGDGRLAEPQKIVDFVIELLSGTQDYKDKTVLITAGATIEPIDSVRFITNHSSGKMGFAIAKKAFLRGSNVIFIYGNVIASIENEILILQNSKANRFFKAIKVNTTEEMYREVMSELPLADIIIKAAAPADYKPKDFSKEKIKSDNLNIEFVKNKDIAAETGKIKGNKKLIVFAAETDNLIENAKIKLQKKKADMVIANDILSEGAGFNKNTNIVSFVTKDKVVHLEKMTKDELSDKILDKILTL